MNLGAMKDRVYAVIRDGDRAFVTDEEVEDWLNEAYVDLATRTRVLHGSQTQAAAAVEAGGKITLPLDCFEVLSLRSGDDDVEFVDDVTFYSWIDDTGIPPHTLARVFNRKIETYPQFATTASYTLEYTKFPTGEVTPVTILNTGEDEPLLPEYLHRRLVDYARAEALIKMREFDQAEAYYARYERGLPAPAIGRQELVPSPMNRIPVPGPFDQED